MSDTAPVVEASAEPVVNETAPVAETPVEKPNSTKLLDLAKKEAQFVKKEVEYKTKLSEYEKQLEELKYFKGAKDIIGKNPEELLSKLGISYDELTRGILDYYDNLDKNAKPPSVEELRKEISKEFEAREAKKYEEQASAAITGFQSEIKSFIASNEEAFPHLTKLGSTLGGTESTEDLVFQIVSNYFEETNELLDLKTAAETAEEYFRDEWNKLNGVLSTKKEVAPPSAPVESVKEVSKPRDANAVADIVSVEKSGNRFKEKIISSPSINNNIPVASPTPFKQRRLEREELIAKAVAAYDNVARAKK